MYRFLRTLLVAAFCLSGGAAWAADKVGVVLVHGKASHPDHFIAMIDHLEMSGYLVVAPEMPWSRGRAYDASLTAAHEEIDGAILTLKEMGAGPIVIAGHSMGANMAMTYAATHDGLAAVIAMGPGQTVESQLFRDTTGTSVEKAKAMIGAGQGDVKTSFAEMHFGKASSIQTTANIYLGYFDPDGLANMPKSAARLKTPFLWTVGTRDKNMLDRGRAYAFDKVPAHPLNQYAVVEADHMGTPDASIDVVLDWLGRVFPRS